MKRVELGEAPFKRGQRVTVHEEGIRPWSGSVLSVKPSPVSGWWLEVDQDDGTGCWIIRAADVTEADRAEVAS